MERPSTTFCVREYFVLEQDMKDAIFLPALQFCSPGTVYAALYMSPEKSPPLNSKDILKSVQMIAQRRLAWRTTKNLIPGAECGPAAR
jgi:hypothetical protein